LLLELYVTCFLEFLVSKINKKSRPENRPALFIVVKKKYGIALNKKQLILHI